MKPITEGGKITLTKTSLTLERLDRPTLDKALALLQHLDKYAYMTRKLSSWRKRK